MLVPENELFQRSMDIEKICDSVNMEDGASLRNIRATVGAIKRIRGSVQMVLKQRGVLSR